MCGRVRVRATKRELEEAFDAEMVDDFGPRYNLAPTEMMPVVLQEGARRIILPMQWGFPSDQGLLINARSESVAHRPTFRDAFLRRRCLIAADAFYEWRRSEKMRQPFLIERNDSGPFALAGIWESVPNPRCCVLTTESNELVRSLHDRMPVILSPEEYGAWLDPSADEPRLKTLLRPFDAAQMHMYPVSTKLNRAGYDDPDCEQPIQVLQPTLF
jgi:putative SOS response-associated peptidase YedK